MEYYDVVEGNICSANQVPMPPYHLQMVEPQK